MTCSTVNEVLEIWERRVVSSGDKGGLRQRADQENVFGYAFATWENAHMKYNVPWSTVLGVCSPAETLDELP